MCNQDKCIIIQLGCLIACRWCTILIWCYFGFIIQFHVLLPPLHELILEIQRDNIRGGQLLNLLHKRCHCGVPELQLCIQRYVWWSPMYHLENMLKFHYFWPSGILCCKQSAIKRALVKVFIWWWIFVSINHCCGRLKCLIACKWADYVWIILSLQCIFFLIKV